MATATIALVSEPSVTAGRRSAGGSGVVGPARAPRPLGDAAVAPEPPRLLVARGGGGAGARRGPARGPSFRLAGYSFRRSASGGRSQARPHRGAAGLAPASGLEWRRGAAASGRSQAAVVPFCQRCSCGPDLTAGVLGAMASLLPAE